MVRVTLIPRKTFNVKFENNFRIHAVFSYYCDRTLKKKQTVLMAV